jgi:hypothetical protein
MVGRQHESARHSPDNRRLGHRQRRSHSAQRAPIALESINSGIAIAYFNAAGIPDALGGVWTSSSPNILNVGLLGCNNSSASTCPVTVGDGALFQPGASAAPGSTTCS